MKLRLEMMSVPVYRRLVCAFTAVLMLVAVVPGALMADDLGPEEAQRLLRSGRIKALGDIVTIVQKQVDGDLIDAELDEEDGVYIYELKILRRDGRLQEIEADASTGKILKIEDDD
ncbi:putative lipoprotein [Hyphomicrobium sulfonivorans]|uniref:Putative lipoprotein n=2 Tax=Hyphomicrobium sulfonivorans TaxID=121290 RepID=A0A109BDM3_HYPSL|nr:PepSY domain-containing protein [Hyphomicrobium sulfonivorans]KWT66821.1 putative lipoprotein [Hyphomicrobium sulfonivorans]